MAVYKEREALPTIDEIFKMLPKTWKSGKKKGSMPKPIAEFTARRIWERIRECKKDKKA